MRRAKSRPQVSNSSSPHVLYKMLEQQLRRGKEKRLRKRYEAYDRQLFFPLSLLAIFACVLTLIPTIAIASCLPSDAPKWMRVFCGFSILALASIPSVAIYSYLGSCISRHFADKYRLLCANCGNPLATLTLNRWRHNEDRRGDGEVPRRCPHCHVAINEATATGG